MFLGAIRTNAFAATIHHIYILVYEYQQEIAIGIYYYWYRRHYHGSMEFDHVRNGGSESSWNGSPTGNGLEYRNNES